YAMELPRHYYVSYRTPKKSTALWRTPKRSRAMNFHARNLSVTLMAAVSGIALSVCLSPAFAQAYDSPERNRVNADGMPTTHSTPAEKAETARINRQIGTDNRAVDDRAQADNNRYQAQQSQYQGQLQDNRTK